MNASESITQRLYAEQLLASRSESRTISVQRLQNVFATTAVIADFLTCVFAILATYSLSSSLSSGKHIPYPLLEAAAVSLSFSIVTVLLMHRNGAYHGSSGLLQIQETERAIRVPLQSALVILPFGLFLSLAFTQPVFLLALVAIPVLLILQKHASISVLRRLHIKGCGTDRVIVYGIADTNKRILSTLSRSLWLGLRPVAVIDDHATRDDELIPEMGYRRRRSIPVRQGPITSALLSSCQCGTLIVALPNLSPKQIVAAVDAAHQVGSRVMFLSSTELQEQKWTESIEIDGLSLAPMLELSERWPYSLAKRAFDLTISSLLLVLFAPLLFLIALLIRIDSSGPSLFVQVRVGRNGELFKIYKFRSMQRDTPQYDLSPTTPFDPRITRIGRFLRRSSLDELPQLINVFLGNMSLVGPRPEMSFVVQLYTPEQRQRLQVTPGITGLWQLSADRTFPIHENIQYDLYYIRNRNLFMDLAILIHTLLFAMRGGI